MGIIRNINPKIFKFSEGNKCYKFFKEDNSNNIYIDGLVFDSNINLFKGMFIRSNEFFGESLEI
jgi:hypothetical protein